MSAPKRTRKRSDKPRVSARRVVLDDVRKLIRETKAKDPLPVFKEQLEQHGCLDDFNALVDARCSERPLMDGVTAVKLAFAHHERLKSDPVRMDAKRLRSLVEKTRTVASEWEQEFQSPFGKEVLGFATRCDPAAKEEEFHNIPQRLLLLASWAEDIHSKTKHQRRPVYDDALAELTEYVKHTTGNYYDEEVSALVSFARQDDPQKPFNANALIVFRSEHRESLEGARVRLARR